MTDSTPSGIPLKQCRKCKHFFPATREFFYVSKSYKDGFLARCKSCSVQSEPRPILPTGMKRCSKCKGIFPSTKEFFYGSAKKPDGLMNRCKSCESEVKKERYQRNGDVIRQQNRESYYANHEKRLQRVKQYAMTHREQKRTSYHRYRNRPEVLERLHTYNRVYSKQYYARPENRLREHLRRQNPRVKAQRSVYQRSVPHLVKASHQRRRSRLIAAPGSHTGQDILKQLKRQHGRCYYCHCRLGKYHVDHIIPLSRGGSNDPDNLVLACRTCNLKKGKKLLHEWSEGGRLL